MSRGPKLFRNHIGSQILIWVLLLSIVACSDSNQLDGETFVNFDESESLYFLDEKHVDYTEDGGTFEGDYSIEKDGRIRLAVSFLGMRMVAYGTMNEDGGLTVEFEEPSPTRFFLANDPKLLHATNASETLLETQSKVCKGLCKPMLVPKQLHPLVITDVDLTGIGRDKILFAEIQKVEFSSPRDSRDKSVTIQVKGYDFFDGGWRELRFSEQAARDEFYRTLVAAIREWHLTFGVAAFNAEDLPESVGAPAISSVQPASAAPKALKPTKGIDQNVLLIEEQFSEGLASAVMVKMAIAESSQQLGRFPTDNAEAGLSEANASSRYVASFSITPPNGMVTITFGGEASEKLAGHSAYLVPTKNGRWECYSDRTITTYASRNCQKALPTGVRQ